MSERTFAITGNHFNKVDYDKGAGMKREKKFVGPDLWLVLAALRFVLSVDVDVSGLSGPARKQTTKLEKKITKIFL